MKTIIKSTNWRGVPCTLRYDNSLKPVCEGDMIGESRIVGGSAPHKEGSTGYMSYENGDSRYVHECHWIEDFVPNAYAVMARYKKKVMNMTTRKKEWDTWSQVGSYSFEMFGEDQAYLMAHGRARLLERYDHDNEAHVKAILDPHYPPSQEEKAS